MNEKAKDVHDLKKQLEALRASQAEEIERLTENAAGNAAAATEFAAMEAAAVDIERKAPATLGPPLFSMRRNAWRHCPSRMPCSMPVPCHRSAAFCQSLASTDSRKPAMMASSTSCLT